MRRMMAYIAGALTGALVGASIALLFAPVPGEELQARINERFSSLRDELKQAYETRLSQLEAEFEALRAPRTK